MTTESPFRHAAKPDWYAQTARFARPDPGKAKLQLLNTLLPYVLVLNLMFLSIHLHVPYAITLGLAVIGAAYLVRIFIIFHDCTHGSFLPSPRANRIIGYITGILTFTPFDDWRRTHAVHHVTAGDLDRRGTGDIRTLTVEEYREASFFKRLGYRLYRSPLVMFGLGPGWVFLLRNRFPFRGWKRRDLYSVLFTNIALLTIISAASATVGLRAYAAVQLPVLLIAATVGIWLFYIQHNFRGIYWARHEKVDPIRVALEGASYYKLPRLLQWFTANIGFHHLHHIRPGIPNYRLQECFEATPQVHVPPLTIRKSLSSLSLKLIDEENGGMVGFTSAGIASTADAQGAFTLNGLRGLLVDIWNVFLLHAVVAHVNNGLIPAAAFLLLLSIATGDVYLERTVLHLLLIALCMIPVSFFSGILDWRRKFHGARAPVFFRKIWLTVSLFLLVGSAAMARLSFGQSAFSRWIYAGCVFASFPVVVLLGHYGAKLASARK
ncbi:Fatty acid desaturase [Geobacter sp. DSM 9736]|nr:Fatty acid desaturase [Geobacter sp. DSM 9736]